MASPEIKNLARRLVMLETGHGVPALVLGPTLRVTEELRWRLTELVGIEGFRSLLARALTLATAENPLLNSFQVRPNGSLLQRDGMERSEDLEANEEAGYLLLAHLLDLLVIFIGQSLTDQLLREAWPNLTPGNAESRVEEKL